MIDNYDRRIDYLRVSVTDLCNLRCRYCMPAEGVSKREHRDILGVEEIVAITRAAVKAGISKVRVTGGEPLIRRGCLEICKQIKAIPGVKELSLTTNGLLLEDRAQQLKEAGVDRVNISIDTLDAEKYAYMTRGGDLEKTWRGIRAAAQAGLLPIKLNTVLIGGFNDDEIPALVEMTKENDYEWRFIEVMPIGEGIPFWEKGFVPNSAVLERVPALMPVEEGMQGVAKLYRLPGAKGKIGLINPISSHFCQSCNRLRLTADGMLKPCLHSGIEVPVRGLEGEALEGAIAYAVSLKPQSREQENLGAGHGPADRNMNRIGG